MFSDALASLLSVVVGLRQGRVKQEACQQEGSAQKKSEKTLANIKEKARLIASAEASGQQPETNWPEPNMTMTDKQIEIVGKALATAGKTTFARPQQIACLRVIMTESKIDGKVQDAIVEAFGPFCNASAMLQDLKKLGVIASELTAAQKEQAATLAKMLKG